MKRTRKSCNQDTRYEVRIAPLMKLGYDLKMVTIGILKKATPSTLRDINRLLAILREDKGKTAGTISELRTILSDKNTAVVTVKDAKRIATARLKKASSINLTSRPSRIAANKLYQKLGFKVRETHVYKLDL